MAPVLHHSAARLWQPQGLRARYLRYLVTMHTVIRASVPLMERARAHCRDAPATDSAARPLGSYLSAHIPRERHHDTWLLRDMEAAGLHPGHELARPPRRRSPGWSAPSTTGSTTSTRCACSAMWRYSNSTLPRRR